MLLNIQAGYFVQGRMLIGRINDGAKYISPSSKQRNLFTAKPTCPTQVQIKGNITPYSGRKYEKYWTTRLLTQQATCTCISETANKAFKETSETTNK